MKGRIIVFLMVFMLTGGSLYAASGDLIVNGNLTVQGTVSAPNAHVMTKYYESPEQTITSAGALTLPHGLGVEPAFVQVILVCKTAQANYAVGDRVIAPNFGSLDTATYSQGVAIVPDSTNLSIRFGSNATVFTLINKNTGGLGDAVNASWKVIFRAWAF